MPLVFRYWLLLLLAPLLSAGSLLAQVRLIPYRQGSLWGYADRQHRVRIAPAYDNVTFFHRGLARVLRDGKWAYLDSTGRLLTPLAYTWLGRFHENRAGFERDGRQGYLDAQGREVLLLDTARALAERRLLRQAPRRWYRKAGRAVYYEPLPLHETLPDSVPAYYATTSDFYQNWAVVQSPAHNPYARGRYYYLNRQGRFLSDSGFTQLQRHVNGLVLVDGHTLLDTTGRVVYHQAGVFIQPNVRGPGDYQGRGELPAHLWPISSRPPKPGESYPPPGTRYGLLDGPQGRVVLPTVFQKIEALALPVSSQPYRRQPATLFLVTDSTDQQFVYDYQRNTRSSRYTSLRPAYVRPLGDFLFEARRDTQRLLIDRNDRVIIRPGFTDLTLSEVSPTSAQTILPDNPNGFVLVRQGKLVGLYDYRGRRLAKPRYLAARLISDGVADMIVRPNVGHFFTPRGRLRNKTALRAHRRHKLQVECQRTVGSVCYRMADTLYHVLPDSLRRHQIDRTVLQGAYLHIRYTEVRNGKPTYFRHEGVLDTTGRVIVPFGRQYVELLRPGYYVAKNFGNIARLYTPRGAVIIAMPDSFRQRDNTFSFSPFGPFFTTTVAGRSLLYDSTGRLLDELPRHLDLLSRWPSSQPLRYTSSYGQSRGFTLLDERGQPLSAPEAGYGYAQGSTDELKAAGLLWVERLGKWGFVDARGRTRIGFQFEAARSFHEGLAAVSLAGRWGFIDSTGRVVIAAQYDSVSDFGNGLAVTIRRNLYAPTYQYIDRQGRPAFTDQLLVRYTLPNVSHAGDPPYEPDAPTPRLPDGRRLYNDIQPFYRGRAKVRRHFGTGYIDVHGREVIPTRYSYPTTNFTDDVVWGSYRSWAYVLDSTGRHLDSLFIASPSGFVNGLSVMSKGAKLPPSLKLQLEFGDPKQPLTGYLYWRPTRNGQGRQMFGLRADVLDPVRLMYPHRQSAVPVDAGLGRPAVRLVVAQREEGPEQPRYSTRIHSLPDGRVLHQYPGQMVAPFRQGLARAFYTQPLEPEGSRQVPQFAVGLIRPDGQVVIPYQYQQAGDMSEGLIPVQLPAQAGYIDLVDGRPFFSE